MAPKRPRLAIATTGPLSDSLRIPSTSSLAWKTLSKHSRSGLLALALEWLKEENQGSCAPFLAPADDDYDAADDLYPAASSIEELRETYEELRQRKGTRKELVTRVLEGDWVSESPTVLIGTWLNGRVDSSGEESHCAN